MSFKQITIEINDSGAAFEDNPQEEVARILKQIFQEAEYNGLHTRNIYDINGNPCGFINII